MSEEISCSLNKHTDDVIALSTGSNGEVLHCQVKSNFSL